MPQQIDPLLYDKTLVEMHRQQFERGYVPEWNDFNTIEQRAYKMWKHAGGVAKYVTAGQAVELAKAYGEKSVRQNAVDMMYDVAQLVIQIRARAGDMWCETAHISSRLGPRSGFHEKFGTWTLPEWLEMCGRLKRDGFLVLKDEIYWLE